MLKLLFFIVLIQYASFSIDNDKYSFGKIKEGKVITHIFKIKNTSKIPLLIYSVSTTCGCTTSDYSKIIKPNKEGFINIKFDSKNNKGVIKKFIVVMTNAKEEYKKLTIEGHVF